MYAKKGHLQFCKMADKMCSLKNEALDIVLERKKYGSIGKIEKNHAGLVYDK